MLLGSVLIQLSFSGKDPKLLLPTDGVLTEIVLMAEMFCRFKMALCQSETRLQSASRVFCYTTHSLALHM